MGHPKFGKVWWECFFLVALIVIDHPPEIFHKGITYFIIVVFVVIQDAIAVAVNGGAKQKFYLMIKIDKITNIGQEAIGITHFIEQADICWQFSGICPPV